MKKTNVYARLFTAYLALGVIILPAIVFANPSDRIDVSAKVDNRVIADKPSFEGFSVSSPSHDFYKTVKKHNDHIANVRKKARIEALRQRELARVVVYTKPVQKLAVRTPATYGGSTVWDRLAICESGGNWAINTGNGYYGGLQFSLSSWRGVGGSGFPHQASRDEQIKRAEMLKSSGGFGHWPACSERLGLL